MEDDRLWGFEQSLWLEGRENYREKVGPEILMVLPRPPYILSGEDAITAVIETPVWDRAELTDRHAARPQEGLIVVAYRIKAEKDGGAAYEAWCTSTYRRIEHEKWHVIQHHQSPVVAEA